MPRSSRAGWRRARPCTPTREAGHWDALHARFAAKRINHSFAFSDDGARTNQVEGFFSRLRRAEIGQHHHISGPHLRLYAGEMAWREDTRREDTRREDTRREDTRREDTRREDTGALWELAGVAALAHAEGRNWSGYWQRHAP